MRLTTTEAAQSLQRQYGGNLIPPWTMRRVVDELHKRDAITIQWVGVYRTVSPEDLLVIAEELQRMGWLPLESASCK